MVILDIISIDNILLSIVNWVYSIICQLYTSFLLISRVNIFKNNGELLTDIVRRVYYMIGVVMLFVLAYSLLRQIVNPEQKDKKTGFKMILGILKAIIVIAVTPVVFTMAFDVQNAIFQKNTIGKIILGTNGNSSGSSASLSKYISTDPTKAIERGGNTIAVTIYRTFFRPYYADGHCDGKDETIKTDTGYSEYEECINEFKPSGMNETFGQIVEKVGKDGNFDRFEQYADKNIDVINENKKAEYINFNPIFSLICGLFCGYM